MPSLSCETVDSLFCQLSLITCERERLKESLPKDGEMPQLDIWYQMPGYSGLGGDLTNQDLFLSSESKSFPYPVPSAQQEPPLHPSAQNFSYSTLASEFSPIASQIPMPREPTQGQAPGEEFISLSMPGLSTRMTTAPGFSDVIQSWPASAPQVPRFDTGQPGLYYLPQEPQIDAEMDRTIVRSPVSYQTPDSSTFTPEGQFRPEYTRGYGKPLFTTANQQIYAEDQYGLGMAHEQNHYGLRENPSNVPRYGERSVSYSNRRDFS